MTQTTKLAERWHNAMLHASDIDTAAIRRAIANHTDTGIRATRYDRGTPATTTKCSDPEHCIDGPDDHAHPVTNDPTGNAAVSGGLDTLGDYRRLRDAEQAAAEAASVVLDFVAGETVTTWDEMLTANARLMPGTVAAGLDVDHERLLPRHIEQATKAIDAVRGIARAHLPRQPTTDEQHWTAGLADEDCCVWHLAIHRRYRRLRAGGTNVCQSCVQLVTLSEGVRPPTWLLEAEIDRGAKPKAWSQALGRWMEELSGRSSHSRVGGV